MIITFISILIMIISVIKLLLSGTAYSYIRDMLFGYGTDTSLVNSGRFMLFLHGLFLGLYMHYCQLL